MSGPGIYICWDASKPRTSADEQAFKADDHSDAAEQFAKLYWEMGNWRVDAVGVDNEDGDVRTIEVARVERFEARARG